MKLKDICNYLDAVVPLAFQESYDNSGLQTGDSDIDINSALLTLDVTEEVLNEAEKKGCNLIISHHPLIFGGIKRISANNVTGRILISAIKKDIAIYSSHTNLDSLGSGVSRKMALKLNLQNIRVLVPMKNSLLKLITYIPEKHLENVKNALFAAGAGVIGNYDQCGFAVTGTGSFRANENAKPFAGEIGKVHKESEVRFETILYAHLRDQVIDALLASHPYEEVAYDLYTLANENNEAGLGCIGELSNTLSEIEFLNLVASVFDAKGVRFSKPLGKDVRKVALCGGSGSSFLKDAVSSGAEAYVTADIKYHNFFETGSKILLVDVGHYESEKFSSEIIYDLIIKKFPKFAVRFSETNTNPINYL